MLVGIALVTLCSPFLIYAQQTKAPPKVSEETEEMIQSHEVMSKAHIQAANCLRSGKNRKECSEEYDKVRRENLDHEFCERMMKRRRNKGD